MAEANGVRGSTSPPPQRRVPPMITLPSRSFSDTLLTGLSPGPMTLVSNFFSDHYPNTDLGSFSQLLAEVLPSPLAHGPPTPLLYHDSSSNCQKHSEVYKQIQPVELVTTLQAVLPQCVQPQNQPSIYATSKEKSRTTQTSDDDDSQIESVDNFSVFQSDSLKPEPVLCASVTKPASDGYNWRKYGQKQVKGSELPRSYYKCMQINCSVTKKIGHFLDGSISDIIYKGQHNHEPPILGNGAKDVVINQKKRKLEVGWVDLASSSQVMVSEPKFVVQMRSEVDILDDGFKWRKYGQKVVKGNTYPRSYYRCTYAGCKVRKHVERAYSDPKSVVTTYEGKHKHDIPVVAKPSSSNETNFNIGIPIRLELKEEQMMT